MPTHPPIAEKQAEVVVSGGARSLEWSPFFGVFVQTSTKYFIFRSPISSPICRGFCTMKRRRFNDLGEMKACLQSRRNKILSPFSGCAEGRRPVLYFFFEQRKRKV